MEEVEGGISVDGVTAVGERGPFGASRDRHHAPDRPDCRFLLREAADGALDPPEGIDSANRCVALIEPVPQSARQQELVCLASAHVNCPRYLRGLLLAGAPPPRRARDPLSPAIVGAALILSASLVASFGFLVVRGGFDLPLMTPSPSPVALASAPALVPAASSDAESARPDPGPSAPVTSPSIGPAPSAQPASPSPTASPTVRPTIRPTPRPEPTTSDRYALLTRCSSGSDCWIYVVRSGDNLFSIANYFGVSSAQIRAMNPSLGALRAGYRLRIPTPTR